METFSNRSCGKLNRRCRNRSRVFIESMEERISLSAAQPAVAAQTPPRFDHVVIVVEENHSYSQIINSGSKSGIASLYPWLANPAPFINQLAKNGASFTNFSGLAHPSEPNYIALFSGSTHGITSDAPPATHSLGSPSLGGELIAAGDTFACYSESLPSTGFNGRIGGNTYKLSHNPLPAFSDVPGSANKPFSAFPTDFTKLPTVSLVVPNDQHNMHSASVSKGDAWLKTNLGAYAAWAKTHNSLLIVTWDEGSGNNHIATIFYGAHVVSGQYTQRLNHYNTLRTVEDMYGLPRMGHSADAGVTPITNVFSA